MDTTADQGATVKLDCLVEGEPTPTVTWLKSGYPIQTGQGITILANKTLVIMVAKQEDSGSYVCKATNQMGPQAISVFVTIRGKSILQSRLSTS